MQQHVANILPSDSPTHPRPLCRERVKIQLFSKHGHVAYQIKGNEACSKVVANILLSDCLRHPTLGWDQNYIFFSDHGHVAYQFKGNDACSNVVVIILPADKPHPQSKFNFYTTWLCCISK